MTDYTPQAKQAALQKVVAIATNYLGVREVPDYSNKGPEVERFLRNVGLDGGNPWCMAFVYTCFQTANYVNVNGLQILIPTGSCQTQADHARDAGLLVAADDAHGKLAPGWVMLQWHPELDRYAHCGIVTKYDAANDDFFTIEGNSNETGAREGDCVCRQHRNLHDQRGGRSRYAFIQTA
jgi:hypothetical protein